MVRKTVRIVRFADQGSFRRVVDFLCDLYPEADRASFEVGLARLPAKLSHDAEESSAAALAGALEQLGARVLVGDVPGAGPKATADVGGTMDVGSVIDAAFLERSKKSSGAKVLGSARALPSQAAQAPTGAGRARAPWDP